MAQNSLKLNHKNGRYNGREVAQLWMEKLGEPNQIRNLVDGSFQIVYSQMYSHTLLFIPAIQQTLPEGYKIGEIRIAPHVAIHALHFSIEILHMGGD